MARAGEECAEESGRSRHRCLCHVPREGHQLIGWLRRKHREEDLEREVRSDLELEAEEQQENGLSPEEAHYAARRAFGNAAFLKEEVREMWGTGHRWSDYCRMLVTL